MGHFKSLESFLTNLENQLQCASEFASKALKHLFFVLIVFITPENMSYIFTRLISVTGPLALVVSLGNVYD